MSTTAVPLARPSRIPRIPAAAVPSIALRGAIAAAWAYVLANPGLPQLHDPATHARTLAWPIGLLAVPLVLARWSRGRGYPFTVDALLALPFALDSIANVTDLYRTRVWCDTLNHGVAWFGLALLATMPAACRGLAPWLRGAIAIGAGAAAAIAWELGEFVAFLHASYGEHAYVDTLTDLSAGLCGSIAAAVLIVVRSGEAR